MESLARFESIDESEGLSDILGLRAQRLPLPKFLVPVVLSLLFLVSAVRAQCPSSLSPTTATVPSRGASADGATRDSFRVFGVNNCKWTAESQVSWITISLGQTGTNNGIVGYAVQQNLTPVSRSGTIRVGDQIFTVLQGGSSCTLTLSGTGASIPAGGGSGTFRVETTCQWTASSNSDWILASGGATGSGNVSYTVLPNPTSSVRTGLISIYDKTFVITQDRSPCTINVTPAQDTVPAAFSGTKTVRVDTITGCAWSVSNPATWAHLSPAAGTGGGLVSVTVDQNLFAEQRIADISIGGASYRLTQQGAACTFSLSPGSVSIPSDATTGFFSVGTTCSYMVQSLAEWLVVRSSPTGTGSGRVDYSVLENKTAESRTSSIRVGTGNFTVTQSPPVCQVQLDPASVTFASASNASGKINVVGSSACWTAESFSPWITITSIASTSNGTGSVTYAVDSNPNSPARTGTIQIGPKSFTITQAGLGVFFTSESVAHGATTLNGPVTPGEVIVIYGVGMGPAQLTTAELTSDGTALTTLLAGTRVWFNGAPGAMVYTSAGQVSTVVPYSVAGRPFADVVIEYNGLQSSVVTLPVTTILPGIFTNDKTGIGPGAILNQDYGDNSLIPAEKNTIVQIFATGEGETDPPSSDGRLATVPLPKPKLPVRVFVDGIEAEVTYYGAAPGLVAGVLQVNARIPSQVRSGRLPILLRMADTFSRTGVTVNVK